MTTPQKAKYLTSPNPLPLVTAPQPTGVHEVITRSSYAPTYRDIVYNKEGSRQAKRTRTRNTSSGVIGVAADCTLVSDAATKCNESPANDTSFKIVEYNKRILKGRPYEGIALMWRKSLFPSVSIIDCTSDRLAAVQIDLGGRHILVMLAYLPFDDGNEDCLADFIACLGSIEAVISDSDIEAIYVLGDFNAHCGTRFAPPSIYISIYISNALSMVSLLLHWKSYEGNIEENS
ncbi:unnamed protein product [Leptidea sinapis]|uniref:Endonuclease/exonuclease/phosphatase domain-containing protein n=1 Tax=Leptidea sinapis TaxID=189913 RepID=A0A5E4Q3U6_9NEOP|nr:unnamed protein product [Leptidea sinapis]